MTLSREANRDLIDLWVYGARQWGIDRANDYYDQIDDALLLLATYPEIGTLQKRKQAISAVGGRKPCDPFQSSSK